MKKFLIGLVLLCLMLSGCTATQNTEATIIEDVVQFSRISVDELKAIMGEPVSAENWTNKTGKGNFSVTTLSYDKNANHYEFIIADNSVVRLTIYSEDYWNGTGNRFSYKGAKQNICKAFNVELSENAKKAADTNYAFKISPVNDKVAVFDIQDMDKETYGFLEGNERWHKLIQK